jgi:hypothetical protein
MDALVRKLTRLIESDDMELRTAAVRVVAELDIRSKRISKALAACLQEPYEPLQVASLRALARLGARDVSHVVAPLILRSGPLREQAMAVILAVGPPVVPQLKDLYRTADFHGKRGIIAALSRIGSKDALHFLLESLPGESFELQKHLTLHVCEALDQMQPTAQAAFVPAILALLRSRLVEKSPQLLITAAILLGHLRGSNLAGKARDKLRYLADPKFPSEVRRHAMVSLGRLFADRKPADADEAFICEALCDEDWQNVAQHALSMFQRLSFPRSRVKELARLLDKSPHSSVHVHVFELLESVDRPEVVEAILPFLSDSRFRVREAAEAALRRMPSSIDSLFQLLVETDDLEVTQRVNGILRDLPEHTRRKLLPKACSRLLSLFEQNDPHYESFLDFVRAVDPEPLRQRIYERCHKLKASNSRDRWERMTRYLQLLWDNHLITAEGRYLFAVAQLRTSAKDLAPASRRANMGLQVIRALIYNDSNGLLRRLKADKALTPEDYYYLGFHFAEEGDELEPFAVGLLKYVARTLRNTKGAAAAVHKLTLIEKKQEEQAAAEEKKASKKRSKAAGSRAAARATGSAAESQRAAASGGRGQRVAVSAGARTPKAPAGAASKSKAAASKKASKKKPVARRNKAASKKATSKKTTSKKATKPKKSAKKPTKKPAAKKSGSKTKSSRRPIRIKKSGSATAAKKARKKPVKAGRK